MNKAKRLVLSATITGLVIWGFTELFWLLLVDAFGLGETGVRLAPAAAGATLGLVLSMIRMKVQAMRQKFLEEEKRRLEGADDE